jgi:hypothetical protein
MKSRSHFLLVAAILFGRAAICQVNQYLEKEIPISENDITGAAISHNGRFLACGDESGTAYVWDLQAQKPLYKLAFHKGAIRCLSFDSGNQSLFTGSEDGCIAAWDLFSGKRTAVFQNQGESVRRMDLSLDDKLLAAAGKTKIHLFEPFSGRYAGTLDPRGKEILLVAFHLSGDQLLTLDEGGAMNLWSASSQRLIRTTQVESRTMKNSGVEFRSGECSDDRNLVAVGLEEHVVAKGGAGMVFRHNLALFDWNSGAEISTLENLNTAGAMAVSPDKKYAILDNSTLRQHQFSFLNLEQGTVEKNVPVGGEITYIDASEDGRRLVVALTVKEAPRKSYLQVWALSGVNGFERFGGGPNATAPSRVFGLGPALSFTTAKDPLISFGGRKRVAVLYFDSPGWSEDIAKTTTYLVESKLGNSPFVELVERNQINKIIEELKYQMTGLTASDALEVGRHLNANYILMGSINKLGNTIILTAKLVNVETSGIEGTREIQCRNATVESIPDIVSAMVPAIVRSK